MDQKAYELLQTMPPVPSGDILRGRIRRNLQITIEQRSTNARAVALRSVLATGLLVAVVGTAWARSGWLPWGERPSVAPPPASAPATTRAGSSKGDPETNPLGSSEPTATETTPRGPQTTDGLPPHAAGPSGSGAQPGHGPSATRRTDGGTPEEQEVIAAMRLLRQKQDAQGAAKLLDSYMKKHPSGILAEEALAMMIEAKAASDPERASALARRYLAEYPNGSFRDLARRHLRD